MTPQEAAHNTQPAHEPPATVTPLARAEHAAQQAEQHDPRNPGSLAMWVRAQTYALLTTTPGPSERGVEWPYDLRAEPQRTREEMIAAGAKVLNRAATVFRPLGRDTAEAVLIAAGVIDPEPRQ